MFTKHVCLLNIHNDIVIVVDAVVVVLLYAIKKVCDKTCVPV